jgi:hypothetical protein
MKLAETARHNFQLFEEVVTSIMDDSYDEDFTGAIFRAKCNVIRMDSEIAIALYPERSRRCLNLYYARISKFLHSVLAMEKIANELQLKRLEMVYLKLYSLHSFIRELLEEGK